MTWGATYKVARQAAGVRQVDAAAHAGLTQQALSLYERELRTPNVATVSDLMVAIGGRVRLEWPEGPRTDEPHCDPVVPGEEMVMTDQVIVINGERNLIEHDGAGILRELQIVVEGGGDCLVQVRIECDEQLMFQHLVSQWDPDVFRFIPADYGSEPIKWKKSLRIWVSGQAKISTHIRLTETHSEDGSSS